MIVSRVKAEAAVAKATTAAQKALYLGALLSEAIEGEVVVVGGSAVSVYAPAVEPSLDIDFVTPDTAVATSDRVVQAWGFVRRGRRWRRDDWELDLDLLGPNLTGSRSKMQVFSTPYGRVSVIGPEDLVAKRLAELKHWPTTPAWREQLVAQVGALLTQTEFPIDELYLSSVAARDDITDILGDFRRRYRRATG